MPAFCCPSCGATTNRLVYPPVTQGQDPIICCAGCVSQRGDRRVYTGKKLWREEDVYSRDQVKEKNYEFEQRTKAEVARNYQTMRKSARMKMFGY